MKTNFESYKALYLYNNKDNRSNIYSAAWSCKDKSLVKTVEEGKKYFRMTSETLIEGKRKYVDKLEMKSFQKKIKTFQSTIVFIYSFEYESIEKNGDSIFMLGFDPGSKVGAK